MTRMSMLQIGMALLNTWLSQEVMMLWSKFGIWECVKTITANNFYVSTGTQSQSHQSLSNQMSNQSLQSPVRTIDCRFGTCQLKIKRKILKFQTNLCSYIKVKKKLKKLNSIQFTLRWLQAVQLTVSTYSNQTMSHQKKIMLLYMINRI